MAAERRACLERATAPVGTSDRTWLVYEARLARRRHALEKSVYAFNLPYGEYVTEKCPDDVKLRRFDCYRRNQIRLHRAARADNKTRL